MILVFLGVPCRHLVHVVQWVRMRHPVHGLHPVQHGLGLLVVQQVLRVLEVLVHHPHQTVPSNLVLLLLLGLLGVHVVRVLLGWPVGTGILAWLLVLCIHLAGQQQVHLGVLVVLGILVVLACHLNHQHHFVPVGKPHTKRNVIKSSPDVKFIHTYTN